MEPQVRKTTRIFKVQIVKAYGLFSKSRAPFDYRLYDIKGYQNGTLALGTTHLEGRRKDYRFVRPSHGTAPRSVNRGHLEPLNDP